MVDFFGRLIRDILEMGSAIDPLIFEEQTTVTEPLGYERPLRIANQGCSYER